MGLLKTAAKVAVASSVHGRVQRRQQTRWAAADQAAANRQAPPAPVSTSPVPDTNQMIAQLQQLASLRDSGVLTPQEFETQKARILG